MTRHHTHTPITGPTVHLALERDFATLTRTGIGWRELATELEQRDTPTATGDPGMGHHIGQMLRYTARTPQPHGRVVADVRKGDDPFVRLVQMADMHTAALGAPISDQPLLRVVIVCGDEHLHGQLTRELTRAPVTSAPYQAVTLYAPDEPVHPHLADFPRATVEPRTDPDERGVRVVAGSFGAVVPLPGWQLSSYETDIARSSDTRVDTTHTVLEFVDRARCIARWQHDA